MSNIYYIIIRMYVRGVYAVGWDGIVRTLCYTESWAQLAVAVHALQHVVRNVYNLYDSSK